MRLAWITLVSFVLLSAPSWGQSEPDWFELTDLNKQDATRGFLFVDDKLLVSKVGDQDYGHRIEVFDGAGEVLLERVEFPHSVSQIYYRGPQSVLVTGKAYTDQWYTFYTEMTWGSGEFRLDSTRISPQVQINEFGEVGGRFYFTEPGSRSVFLGRGHRMTALPFEISFPSQIVDVGGSMWLLEKRGIGEGDERLVHIDLATNEISRMPGVEGEYGPYNLRNFGSDWLVMDDRLGNRVAVYDTDKRDFRYSVELAETPMNIEIYGQCVVAPTGDAKKIHVIRLHDDHGELASTIDLTGIAGEFTNAIEVEVNGDNGIMFVKSVAPCFFCAESQSAVYGIRTDLDWAATCH